MMREWLQIVERASVGVKLLPYDSCAKCAPIKCGPKGGMHYLFSKTECNGRVHDCIHVNWVSCATLMIQYRTRTLKLLYSIGQHDR